MKHKIFLLAIAVYFVFANAFTQIKIKTQKTIGGDHNDVMKALWLTSDGGMVLGGSSSSNKSGEKSQQSRGGADYWIVKLDHKGKIQFDKAFGGDADDGLSAIQQTTDGGYILGGSTWSDKSGEKKDTSRGWSDYWVIKLDKTGRIEWQKTIGGNDMDFLSCLQQTNDGGYILGGYSYSNKSGEKSENSRGEDDYWIVKLDKRGNIMWDKTIGGKSWDYLFAIHQTNDGGYILGGFSSSNISREKTERSRGKADFWIVKLNRFGKIQWDKTIGGDNEDELYALEQTNDGGYIAGGRSSSNKSGEKTEKGRGADDYWLVKLDKTGRIEWDKTIGGSDYDYLECVRQTRDGGYILGGASWSNRSFEKTENRKGSIYRPDYWIVKIKANSKIQWDKTIGGEDEDVLYDIREVKKNRYVAGGYSGSGISGDKTDTSRGYEDYWLVNLIDTSGTEGTEDASSKISSIALNIHDPKFTIYPNPARSIVHVQTKDRTTISLSDQTGRIILTKIIENDAIISTADLPSGVYFLKNEITGSEKKIMVIK